MLTSPRKLPIERNDRRGCGERPRRAEGHRPQTRSDAQEIGGDSIKELRHRNAAKLKEMIESRHGKVVGLSEKAVEGWIESAKAHEA